MPINPQIALSGVQPSQTAINPLDAYGKVLTLRALMGQERMQDLHARKAEREMNKEDALNQSIVFGPDGKVDRRATLTNVAKADSVAAMTLSHQWAQEDIATGKLTAEAEKARLEHLEKVTQLQGNVARSVQSNPDKPAAWQRAIQFMGQSGLLKPEQIAQLPQQYDENFVTQLATNAEKHAETLARQKADFDRKYPSPESKEAAALVGDQTAAAAEADKQRSAEIGADAADQQQFDQTIEAGGVVTQPYTGTSGVQGLDFTQTAQELSGEGGGIAGMAGTDQPITLQAAMTADQPVGQAPLRMAGNTMTMPTQPITATLGRDPLATARWEKIRGKPPEGTEIDPRTGEYVPLSPANLAALQATKKAGATNVSVSTGHVDLGKTANNQVGEQLLNNSGKIQRLGSIMQTFEPSFQEVPTRITAAWSSLKDKMGVDLSTADKNQLQKISKFKRRAFDDFNVTLKEMSGAAVTPQEYERLKLALPNPGEGIFDGDAPTVFWTKLQDVYRGVRMSQARLMYLKSKGMPTNVESFNKIPLEDMPSIMRARAAELAKEAKARGVPDDEMNASIKPQLAEEFGLAQ